MTLDPAKVVCLISALSHYGLTTQVPHYRHRPSEPFTCPEAGLPANPDLLAFGAILQFGSRRGRNRWHQSPRLFAGKDDRRLLQVSKQDRHGHRD